MKYFVTRILLTSSKTGMRKAVTPKEPVGINNLDDYRKQIRREYEDFDGVNFEYYEANT